MHELALRYLAVEADGVARVTVEAPAYPLRRRGAFACSDETLTDIWATSAHTLRQCTHGLLLDGIKRDRVPWMGDLAVSVPAAAYAFPDRALAERGFIALGQPVSGYVNGIVDYSLWWLICLADYARYFDGADFLATVADDVDAALATLAEEADDDGVARALWVQPQIIGDVDGSGRPKPNKAALDQVRIPADIIVVAIGQGIEIQGFDQAGVPITRGGRLVAALSGQVSDMDNVFAGGDCVTGPATAIRAIAAGKVAAANIDEHLGYHHEIRVDVDIPAPRLNNRPPHGRINTTEREACERKCDFEDIECGLTEEGAVTEASRCLRCDHFGYGIFRGGRDIKW